MRKLCFLVLMLAIAVVGREVPEYLSLTDDVSNDGEISVDWQDATSTVAATSLPHAESRRCRFTGSSRSNSLSFSISPVGVPATLTGRAILLLLCEQRK